MGAVQYSRSERPRCRRAASTQPANRQGPRGSAPLLPSTGSRARPVRARAPVPPQACSRLPERPIVLDVENEEVVLGRCGARAAALMVRELQVVAPARQGEHYTVVAGVALEGGDLLESEGIAVEAHDLRQAVSRPGDPDLGDGRSV